MSLAVAVSGKVKNVLTHSEFTSILAHHKEKTGLPVIVDYYSDGCGPCRQIAPIYKQMSKQYKGRVVFLKVDVNGNRETSSVQQIRSMPTFQFYLNGKKRHQFAGADTNSLQQWADKLGAEGEKYDVQVSKESLVAFYKENAPDKLDEAKLDEILAKAGEGGGPGHYKLINKLKKKYDGKAPETTPAENRMTKKDKAKKEQASAGPSLETASLEDLQEELNKRIEAIADKAEEEADANGEEVEVEDTIKMYKHSDFAERVAIIGSGPAGLSAAIYAARAGLRPVVIAPPMGGQLQGKGVTVENYPAVSGVTGPSIVNDMMKQAAEFGTTFLQEFVESVDTGTRPFTIKTTNQTLKAHSIILATGADSMWLGIEGEEEFRGGGVSSCATCDGFLFRDEEVLVIGGGDTAMEDALVLARTSSKVTVVHRRDSFRASFVMQQRVLEHEKITVLWNHSVVSFGGETVEVPSEEEGGEASTSLVLRHALVKDVNTGETQTINCAAAFVAIGHSPNTGFVKDIVDMDNHGYVITKTPSTYTTVDGVFAAGDVADKIYRQAVTSAGSGAMAALDAERWLSEHGIGDEEAEFEAELLREIMAESSTEEREVDEYPETYREPKKEDSAADSESESESESESKPKAKAKAESTKSSGIDLDEAIEVDADEEEAAHTEL